MPHSDAYTDMHGRLPPGDTFVSWAEAEARLKNIPDMLKRIERLERSVEHFKQRTEAELRQKIGGHIVGIGWPE